MNMKRSFSLWKAQLLLWLINLKCTDEKQQKIFEEQKNALIKDLKNLRCLWISRFLVDLFEFSKYWKIDVPSGLLPSEEELEHWFTEE